MAVYLDDRPVDFGDDGDHLGHRNSGKLSDDDFAAFQAHGVTVSEMIAVIAEIAHCTLTNFTNRLAQTVLAPFLEAYRHGQPE